MRSAAWLWLLWPALGTAADSATATRDIPEEHRPAVDLASRLGTIMFVHDVAAARASDELLERKILQRDPSIRGWLTRPADDGSLEVTWIVENRGQRVARYVVDVPAGDKRLRFRKLSPDQPLTKSQAAQWAARELAAGALESGCTEQHNSVVFTMDRQGERFHLVYLLAATSRGGVMIAGGHHRFEVSADGQRIEDRRAFTKTCFEIPIDENSEGLLLTHLLDATPTEVHVYLSRLHRKPLFVSTGDDVWLVDGSKISLLAKGAPAP